MRLLFAVDRPFPVGGARTDPWCMEVLPPVRRPARVPLRHGSAFTAQVR